MGTARGAVGGLSRSSLSRALISQSPRAEIPFGSLRELTASATVPGDLSVFFLNREKGAWFDPSDVSTLFQDAAGTIPVTGLSQPVGLILDKSGNKNHIAQSIDANRPTLEARINRLVESELFNGVAWSPSNVTVAQDILDVAAPNGTFTAATLTASANSATLTQAYILTATTQTIFSVYLRRRTGTGTIGIQAGSGSYTTVTLTSQWQRFEVSSGLTAGTRSVGISIATSGDAIDVWGAQMEFGSIVAATGLGNPLITASAYQRVVSASNYEDIGLPRYLQFDGIDDQLSATVPVAASEWSFQTGMTGIVGMQMNGWNAASRLPFFQFSITNNVIALENQGNDQYQLRWNGNIPGTGIFTIDAFLDANLDVRLPSILSTAIFGNPLFAQTIAGHPVAQWQWRRPTNSNSLGSGSFAAGNYTLIMTGTTAGGQARHYGALLINRPLSLQEQTGAYLFLANRMGLPTGFAGFSIGNVRGINT